MKLTLNRYSLLKLWPMVVMSGRYSWNRGIFLTCSRTFFAVSSSNRGTRITLISSLVKTYSRMSSWIIEAPYLLPPTEELPHEFDRAILECREVELAYQKEG
jgi:hypothetical protein